MKSVRRTALFLALAFGVVASAQEPSIPTPKHLMPPFTALATATKTKKVQVTVRLPSVVDRFAKESAKKAVTSVVKTADGKIATVQRFETYERVVRTDAPGPLRSVTLPAPDVRVRTTNGAIVPIGKLPTLLAKETPVLLGLDKTFDPYHLLTTKPDTLVLLVPDTKVFPELTGASDSTASPDPIVAFPEGQAKLVCDRPELRVTVWNDANLLVVQAVLAKPPLGKPADPKRADVGALFLDVDGDGTRTPKRDRHYYVMPNAPFAYVEVLGEQSTTTMQHDSAGGGSLRYVPRDKGLVRVDTFAIPLLELNLKPGATIKLAYSCGWAAGDDPSVHSAVLPGKGPAYAHELPLSLYHAVPLADRSPSLRLAQLPWR